VRAAAGIDYPSSYAELRAWFDQDWKCLDYLDWLRWPEGFICRYCESVAGASSISAGVAAVATGASR